MGSFFSLPPRVALFSRGLIFTRARVLPALLSLRKNGLIFLSPAACRPFLAWVDFHARSRFARSTIPEEKWGTTRSLREVLPLVTMRIGQRQFVEQLNI